MEDDQVVLPYLEKAESNGIMNSNITQCCDDYKENTNACLCINLCNVYAPLVDGEHFFD